MEFVDFLKNHKAKPAEGKPFTHTSISVPMGSYHIKPSEWIDFHNIFNEATFTTDRLTFMTERVNDLDYTPLKIDIDLRSYKNKRKRLYELEDIQKICMEYMKNIEEYLHIDIDEERLFFVLEKPKARYDKTKDGSKKTNDKGEFKIKDGVHIMAPCIVTNEALQHIFRKAVMKKCGYILDKYNYDNSYHDIFDRAVIANNNWQMYGSTKPHNPPYLVTHIYKVYTDHVEEIDNTYTSLQLVKLLSVRNKYEETMIKLDKEAIVIDTQSKLNEKSNNKITKNEKNKFVSELSNEELNLITKYVKCLKVERAQSFNTWIEVGWCLHNLHNKDSTLLQTWTNFSKKSGDHINTCELECKEKWDDMRYEGLGMGSLKMWARKDNPVLYKKILETDFYNIIIYSCCGGKKDPKGLSYDIAQVLFKLVQDEHICCVSDQGNVWYYYDTQFNRWINDPKGLILRNKISTELYKLFKSICSIELNKSNETEDENTSDIHERNTECIFSVLPKLKKTSEKSNIMKECEELFRDKIDLNGKKFADKLDSNNNLIGFNNGVYDLVKGEFRKGRPEDYISKSTRINYIPYDENSKHIKSIMDFYKQVFVIKSVRDYILTICSTYIGGGTNNENFDIYSGKGGNGKSKHIELLEAISGDYAVKLSVSLLTQKRAKSNAPTPELARTKGARLATMEEPDNGSKINVGLMKNLTGGDKIIARHLNQAPIQFKPKFKLIFICNDKPELPQHDDGTWRRVRLTEFISKFTYDIQPENVLDFKIDTHLADNFENWAEPFMSILIKYYNRYLSEGINIPDEILEYTNEYREYSNKFRGFMNDKIDIVSSSKEILKLNIIWEEFQIWYRDYTKNPAGPKNSMRKDLKRYLDSKFKKKHIDGDNKGYVGIKIRIKKTTQPQFIPDSCEETKEEISNEDSMDVE